LTTDIHGSWSASAGLRLQGEEGILGLPSLGLSKERLKPTSPGDHGFFVLLPVIFPTRGGGLTNNLLPLE